MGEGMGLGIALGVAFGAAFDNVGVGIAIGLLAAYVLSRLLANVVFGISSTDPLTFIGVPLVLAAVAMVANFLPARRATRMDPAKTLRAD